MKQSFGKQMRDIKESLRKPETSPSIKAIEEARAILASDFSSDFLADIALDINLRNSFYAGVGEFAEKNPETQITKELLEKIFIEKKSLEASESDSSKKDIAPAKSAEQPHTYVEIKTLTEGAYAQILDYIIKEKMTEGVGPGKALLLFMKKEGLVFSDLKYSFAAQSALRKKIQQMKTQENTQPEKAAEKQPRTRIEEEEIQSSLLPELRKVIPAKKEVYKKRITEALSLYLENNSITLPENEFFRLRNDALNFLKKERGPKQDVEVIHEASRKIESAAHSIESREHSAQEVRVPLGDLSEDAQTDAVSLVQTQNTQNIPPAETIKLVEQIGRPRLAEGTPSQKTDEDITLGNTLVSESTFLPSQDLVSPLLAAETEQTNKELLSLNILSESNFSLPTEALRPEGVHSQERAVEAEEDLVLIKKENKRADFYDEMLEIKKRDLTAEVEDLKTKTRKGGIYASPAYFEKLKRKEKALTAIERNITKASLAKEDLDSADIFKTHTDLEKSGLNKKEQKRYLEVIQKLEKRRRSQDLSFTERGLDTVKEKMDLFRHAPWYKKVAFGLALSAFAGAVGGAAGAAGLPLAAGLALRAVGARNTYVGLKEKHILGKEEAVDAVGDLSDLSEKDLENTTPEEKVKVKKLELEAKAILAKYELDKPAFIMAAALSLAVPEAVAEVLRGTGAHIPWTDIKLDKGGLFRQAFSTNGESVTLPVRSSVEPATLGESLSSGEEVVTPEKQSPTGQPATDKTSPVASVSSRETIEASPVAKVSVREALPPQGEVVSADGAAAEKNRIIAQFTEELKNNASMLQDWKKMEADFSQKISLAEAEKARLLNESFVKSGDGTPVLDGSGKPILSGAASETNIPKIAELDKEIARLSGLRDATRSDILRIESTNKSLLMKLNPAVPANQVQASVPTGERAAVAVVQTQASAVPSAPSTQNGLGSIDKTTGLKKIPGGLEIPGGSGKAVMGGAPLIQNGVPENPYLVAQTKVLPTAESFGLHIPTSKVVELENKFTSSFVQQMTGLREAGHPNTVILQNITPEALRLATLDYVKMHETVLGPVGNPIAETLLKTPARVFTIPGNFFRLNPALAQDPTWVRMVGNVENMLSNGKGIYSPGIYGSRLSPQAEFLEQYLVLANMQQRGNLPVGSYQGGVLRTTRG